MNKLILFTLLFAFFTISSAHAQAHMERAASLHHGLNGPVKSVKQFKYEAVEKFGKIEAGPKVKEPVHFLKNYNRDGNIKEEVRYASKGFRTEGRTRWIYDTNGKNAGVFIHNSRDEITSSIRKMYKDDQLKERTTKDVDNLPVTTTIFEYDKKGQWIESSEYDASGVLLSKVLNEYDQQGKLIEYGYYDSKGNLIEKRSFKFADDGKELEYRSYNREGLLEKRISKYDSQNRLIQLDRFSDTETNWKNRVIFTYNEKSQVTQLDSLSSAGGISKFAFQFDENGNVINSSEKDTHGQLIEEITYEYNRDNQPTQILNHHPQDNMREKIVYEYDSYGNWIRKIDYVNEIPLTITRRDILYY